MASSTRLPWMLCAATALLWLTGCRIDRTVATPRAAAAAAASGDAERAASTPLRRALDSLTDQIERTRIYDPSYVRMAYPNGDVPRERGVCSDVIIRAFRMGGVDLQKAVHEDMTRAFREYPVLWGLRRPDANIDHRRVANLMTFFRRKGKQIEETGDPESFLPGDVVAWDLPGGRLHIGMVAEYTTSDSARRLIVHNIGVGARQEDALFAWKIIGHYRWFEG